MYGHLVVDPPVACYVAVVDLVVENGDSCFVVEGGEGKGFGVFRKTISEFVAAGEALPPVVAALLDLVLDQP